MEADAGAVALTPAPVANDVTAPSRLRFWVAAALVLACGLTAPADAMTTHKMMKKPMMHRHMMMHHRMMRHKPMMMHHRMMHHKMM